jgi:hypothetical protein
MGFLGINLNKIGKEEEQRQKMGKSFILRYGSSSTGETDEDKVSIPLQTQYDNAYNNFPLVAGSIDAQVEQIVQDYKFDGTNNEVLNEWGDEINLFIHLRRMVKPFLKNGGVIGEKIPLESNRLEGLDKLKNPVDLKLIDMKTMDIVRLATGEVLAYVQTLSNRKKLVWGKIDQRHKEMRGANVEKVGEISDIFHFKWNTNNSEKHGHAIIHSGLTLLEHKQKLESDLRITIERYLNPIIHAKVGSDLMPANTEDLQDVQGKLEDIYADTEYTTNHLVDLSVLDFGQKGMNFQPILEHVDRNILIGLQTHDVNLATDITSKGSGSDPEVALRASGRHIRAVQKEFTMQFDDQIIKPMTNDRKDHLEFEDVEERQFETEVELIRGLTTDGILTNKKANSLLPEKFHDEDVENTDANPMKLPFGSQALGPDKIKDNPNDPTKTSKAGKRERADKSFVKQPMDDKGSKKKPQVKK